MTRPSPVVLLSAGLTVVAPVFVLLLVVNRRVVADLTVEDGPVEYATALLFLVAAVLFVLAGVRHAAPWRWVLPLGLLSFFVAGEEVSWGQRLLGLSTPAALEASNVQGEMNLHNIEGIHGNVRAVGVVVVLTAFVLLPVAIRRWGPAARLAERWRLPLPSLVALPLVVVGTAYMVGPRLLPGSELFILDEVGELYVSAAWLTYALTTLAPRRRGTGRHGRAVRTPRVVGPRDPREQPAHPRR